MKGQIERVEKQVDVAKSSDDKMHLRDKENKLLDEKSDLRKAKRLREEENQLGNVYHHVDRHLGLDFGFLQLDPILLETLYKICLSNV